MSRLELPLARPHPSLEGHFPGEPILPGVVLLDEAVHDDLVVARARLVMFERVFPEDGNVRKAERLDPCGGFQRQSLKPLERNDFV